MNLEQIISDLSNNPADIAVLLGLVVVLNMLMRFVTGQSYSGRRYRESVLRGKEKAGTIGDEERSTLTGYRFSRRATNTITVLALLSLPFTYLRILDYWGHYIMANLDLWPLAIAALIAIALLRMIFAIIRLRILSWKLKRARAASNA